MSRPGPGHATATVALFHGERTAAAPPTYLVLLRNARMARAVAAVLEDLHAGRGDHAVALVPPVRGNGFAHWVSSPALADQQRLREWCARYLPRGASPLLVGLDEDGMADGLRSLGLAACIGVPRDGDWAGSLRTGQTGERVRLIPVTTARELVLAVAAETSHTNPAPAACTLRAAPARAGRPAPILRRLPAPQDGPRRHRPPVLAGLAGVAGALAIAGLAPAAAVSAQILPTPTEPGHLPPRQIAGAATAVTGAAVKHTAGKAQQPEPRLPARYIVRPGDSLSSVARRFYHNPAAWPVLYWANHKQIRWADLIRTGQIIHIPAEPARIPPPPGLLAPALGGTGALSTPGSAAVPYIPRHASPVATSIPAQAAATTATGYPGGAFGACVVARESGGDPQIMNSTGHYGLYQFSAPTWAEYGGNPADFGNAGVAEQNQVFATAIADDGESNWAPYDGC